MEGGDKVIFDVTAADELMEANDWEVALTALATFQRMKATGSCL